MKITRVYKGEVDFTKDGIEENTKWLNWIMDFSNADLNKMGQEEKWIHRIMAWTFIYFFFASLKRIEDRKYIEFVKRTWNSEKYVVGGKVKDNESQMILLQQFFQNVLKLIFLELRIEKLDQNYDGVYKVNFGLMLGYTYRPTFYIYPDRFKLDYSRVEEEPVGGPVIIQIVRGRKFFYKIEDILSDSSLPTDSVFHHQEREHDDETGKDYLWVFNALDHAKEGDNLFEPEEIELLKSLKIIDGKFEEYKIKNLNLMHNFVTLLNGVPVTWIRHCKGCGRYFLHTTAREKNYCTTHCALRSVARKRYEEIKKDPEKYEAHLEYHRQLARNRHKRIRQEQCGPNVKIQKRKNRKEG